MAENWDKRASKSREEIMSLRDFYYSNTYPNDDGRATHMSAKVYRDLIPFSEYLSNSINNLRKASKVKAECFEVKARTVLKPLFSLLKLKSSDALVFEKPQGYYYVLDWDDEWGDITEFDALLKGRNAICDETQVLDSYNKKLSFKFDSPLDTDINYMLYLRYSDDSIKCRLRELNFSDINDYRISSNNAEIVSAFKKNGEITCHYTGTIDNTLLLFGRLQCKVIRKKDFSKEKHVYEMGDICVKFYNEREGLVVAECDDKELQKLYSNGEEIPYALVGKEEICSMLGDKNVKYSDAKIEIVNNVFGNVGENITLHDLKFEINSPMDYVRKTFKDKNGQFIGMYIELVENEEYSNELYSNVSYFFKETTEYLSDTPTGNGRRFKIGNKAEKFNQLEICEVVGNNQLVQITNLPSALYVEPNTRQLQMQQNALKMLMDKPCIDHAPLLELMNDKRYCNWGSAPYQSIEISEWYRLTNLNYEGCDSQREFVKKALATPDFAILEGPPGSGKTTTILEIIAQMVMRGQKVMLAASTNAAIDNILERIESLPDEVKNRLLAVRIGNESAISDSVKGFTLFGVDSDIRDEIIKRANLVCGTTIGILQHPEFKLKDRTLPVVPLYDCLIVDEASKTTFQEFLVPAIYAKKWILSGDLKQLTPYIEQDSIESSLTQIAKFDSYHQQAQTILMTLEQSIYRCKDESLKKLRFCICADEN
ncbi:MAG: AAA family ATPase, partial [Clostridia bacterium]|nr:AAA family ATPase [Clostridia bacterium]